MKRRYLLNLILVLTLLLVFVSSLGSWQPVVAQADELLVDSGQSLGISGSVAVALGDLDGDGDLDAFVGNGDSPDRIWLNANGIFSYSGQHLGYYHSNSVTLEDLDSDGDLDAFVTNLGEPDMIWRNNNGIFGEIGQSVGGNAFSWDGMLGDLDGDGDLDAFVTMRDHPSQVWLNNGGVYFDSGQRLYCSHKGVSLGDLDGDGDLDAFLAQPGDGNQVWFNTNGTFSDSGQILGYSTEAALGDLDGDGDLDAFVISNSYDVSNGVWINDNGVFSDSGQSLGADKSMHVALGDMDGDGDLDAFVSNWGQGNKVYLNNGGIFTDSGLNLGNSDSFEAALGDVDGNGTLDVFVANYRQPNKVWLNTSTTNTPPTVTMMTVPPIDEGQNFTITGAITDPDLSDTHTATIDWGDGNVEPVTVGSDDTVSGNHTYLDNNAYNISVEVCDSEGDCGSDTLVIIVDNVTPTVGAITAPVEPLLTGSAITAGAPFSDSGVLDIHTALWDWGDGSTSLGIVEETGGSGTVSGSHTYTAPGVYTIQLTVTDNDGDSGESIFQYITVYDPAAGFTTGAGWFDSPAGAYLNDPFLTGKARFGFVTKYKDGTTIPTGKMQFNYKAGDFEFDAESYDWMVVSGVRAWTRGTGSVNGESGYKFMVTAIDGDADSGDAYQEDRVRIKIWQEVVNGDDIVVYDNGLGIYDFSLDGPIEIGGGSIVVHYGK